MGREAPARPDAPGEFPDTPLGETVGRLAADVLVVALIAGVAIALIVWAAVR